jgi:hypothetical protein
MILMMRHTWPLRTLLLFAICAGCVCMPGAAHGDEAKTFKEGKASIQALLRSKQSSDRVQAFYQLKQFHEVDAAKLVLQLGLRDTDQEVRIAAYETLRAYVDDPAVCKLLLGALRKAAKSKDGRQGADVLLAVLLSAEDEETANDLDLLFEKQLQTSAGGALLLAQTADNLGLHGDQGDLPPLVRLSKTKFFEESFLVRRAVVQAMMRIREPATIEALVELLSELEGEVCGDIVKYLSEITKQNYGLDAKAWQDWWKTAKDSFEYPPLARGIAQVAPERVGGAEGSYYGMPLFAQKLVFVFDTSGSMAGPRLAAAQRELSNAITTLPEEAEFGIVVFNSRIDAWQKKLVPATKSNKDAAARFISGLTAREQTGTYDALAAAFNYDAEAVYLLTDGAPTTGRIVSPPEIIAAVTRANLARRLSIYTIGIGVGPDGGLFDAFLKNLAMQNYGQYRRVDQ